MTLTENTTEAPAETAKPKSGRTSKLATITLRPDVLKQAKKDARASGLSFSGYVSFLICANANRPAGGAR